MLIDNGKSEHHLGRRNEAENEDHLSFVLTAHSSSLSRLQSHAMAVTNCKGNDSDQLQCRARFEFRSRQYQMDNGTASSRDSGKAKLFS